MIGLFFGSLFKSIAGALANMPRWAWIALAGVLAALFLWHVHAGWEKAAAKEAFNKGFNVEWRKLQVTERSLNEALASIHAQNLAVEKMVDESNARLKAGSDALATAKRSRNATQSAVQALQASAGRTVARDAPCVPSEAFLRHSAEL